MPAGYFPVVAAVVAMDMNCSLVITFYRCRKKSIAKCAHVRSKPPTAPIPLARCTTASCRSTRCSSSCRRPGCPLPSRDFICDFSTERSARTRVSKSVIGEYTLGCAQLEKDHRWRSPVQTSSKDPYYYTNMFLLWPTLIFGWLFAASIWKWPPASVHWQGAAILGSLFLLCVLLLRERVAMLL